jgi:hypothetical protein
MNAITTPVAAAATPSTRMTRLRRPAALTAALAVALGGAVVVASPAIAGTDPAPSFKVMDDHDSPNPLDAVGGLVFYKAADLGWAVDGISLDDIDDLDYTVESGTSYAPSFQLVITGKGVKASAPDAAAYGRLVWEPYMQAGSLDANQGVYTDVQDGMWWTSKIASGAGSQSDPQPLSFFNEGGDAGWSDVAVNAVAIHQGGTTDSTSLVTDVEFNGSEVPLGNEDTTPFDQAYVDAATAPLAGQVTDLTTYKRTHTHTDAAYDALADQVAMLEDAAADTALATKAKAPFTINGTLKVGKKLAVSGTKVPGFSYSYQWYVAGDAVSKATASTYTLPKSAAGHSVAVKVKATYKDSAGKSHSVTTTSRVLTKVLVVK